MLKIKKRTLSQKNVKDEYMKILNSNYIKKNNSFVNLNKKSQ